MKRFISIVLTAILLVPMTACSDWFTPRETNTRMVLLYIAATERALSPYADGNISDMLREYVPSKKSNDQQLLVFFQNLDTDSPTNRSDATLTRYYTSNSGKIVAELVSNFGNEFDAADPESLARVLKLAESTCKPTTRCMLISSHGTGALPIGYFDGDGEKSSDAFSISRASYSEGDAPAINPSRMAMRESIAYDSHSHNEIDIRDFAQVLGEYHWESVLLDCCYMGAVEVAYQMRQCCDYIIGSPTEILITGFPYPVILDQLFNHPGEEGLKAICQAYYDLYQSQTGALQSGTIALVNCSEMDALADICADITASRRSEMEAVKRLNVQHYYYNSRKDYFFDLGHYFELFASEEQYERFSAQLDKAVPFKASTKQFLGINIEHYSGLSCYVPSASYPILNAYYKQLAWNQRVKILE